MNKSLFPAVFGCALLVAAVSQADEITIAGYEYKNVLITKTSSFYYVQLPEEGRTLSIPVSEVDASTVKMNKDPFYRTPLKEKYEVNRQRRADGEIKDVDPAFRAPASPGPGANASLSDLQGGGGGPGAAAPGGGGLGVARTVVEGALGSFGFQIESGPTSAVAKRPDGTSIELLGPPESLNGIVAKMSGTPAAVDAGAGQMQMFVMQLAPGAAQSFTEALNEAKQNGSSSKSAGGVNINVNRTQSGDNTNMELRLTAG